MKRTLGRYASHVSWKARKMWSEIWAAASPATPEHLSMILSIDGMTSPAECDLLFRLASQLQSGTIVEIGSYRGRSTVALALGARRNGGIPVFSVEPHEPIARAFGRDFGARDRREFLENILRCGVHDVVRLVNLGSEAASKGWQAEVSLLFIDGNHGLDSVRMDFDCWEAHVSEGGLILFHDVRNLQPGPEVVVAEALSTGRFVQSDQVDSIVVLRKIRKGR